MIICTIGILLVFNRVIEKIKIEGLSLFSSSMMVFLSIILLITFIALKDFKYLIIDKEEKTLKWFSLIKPFGKTVVLKNYIGIIKSIEYTQGTEFKTAHLVDKKNMTSIKINGLFYSNFNELFNSLKLKEIKNYDFGFWKYLQLIFSGRMRVK
jgi:hypothetical protein